VEHFPRAVTVALGNLERRRSRGLDPLGAKEASKCIFGSLLPDRPYCLNNRLGWGYRVQVPSHPASVQHGQRRAKPAWSVVLKIFPVFVLACMTRSSKARRRCWAGVDATSTYCYLLVAAEHRDADTWGVHLRDAIKRGLKRRGSILAVFELQQTHGGSRSLTPGSRSVVLSFAGGDQPPRVRLAGAEAARGRAA